MRFGTVLSSRPVYYDRAPLDVLEAYSAATVAPHAATTRWTYTVPTNRKAFIEGTDVINMIDGTVTTAGLAQAAIQVTPSGGGGTTVMNGAMIQTVIGQSVVLDQPSLGLLQPGDALSCFTADPGTGGTHFYLLTAKITEFTA